MATRTWKGRAVAQTQVITITVGGTWATSDTPTFTINGKDVVVTVGATTTVAAVATAMAEAVNGSTISGDNTYTPAGGGAIIGEFTEITAEATSTTVVLTANTAGKPFTISATDNSTSGTFSPATTQAATGPNFFDNADNWSGDTVPVDGDTVVFDSGNVDCLYNIDQNGVTPDVIIVTQGYTGKIGLPDINTDNSSYPYDEYRDKALKLCDSGDAPTSSFTFVTIGEGEGNGSSRLRFDFNTGPVDVTVYNTGQRELPGVPAFTYLGGGNTSRLKVHRGDVGVAILEGETAEVDVLQTAYVNSQDSDANVICGNGVTLTACDIDINGGNVTIESTTSSGTIVQYAGTLNILGDDAHASLTVHEGTCNYRSSGTLTTLVVGNDGTLDASKDPRAKTITNASMYKGGALLDPFGVLTVTNGVDLVQCGLEDVTLDLGRNFTATKSAI